MSSFFVAFSIVSHSLFTIMNIVGKKCNMEGINCLVENAFAMNHVSDKSVIAYRYRL